MAILGSTYPNLQDVASRTNDRKIMKIAEVLNDTNPILDDMPWVEGNLATGHKHSIRSGLPTPTWRRLYEGVANTKSKTVTVTDTCGMLEAFSRVDVALAKLNGNEAEFRASEARPHMEGMSQEMASTLFYGDTGSDPEKFMGLAPRYNSLSGENAGNILTGDGTGSDNTSIWLVTWSEDTCFGIYPKGMMAGLDHEDLGKDVVQDSSSNDYMAYRDHYIWNAGFALKDWRYVVRIANIDVSNLTKNAATGSDLIDLMAQAEHLLPSASKGRMVWYGNKTILSFLDRQMMNRSTLGLHRIEDVPGNSPRRGSLGFRGTPIRRTDALLNTEAVVS